MCVARMQAIMSLVELQSYPSPAVVHAVGVALNLVSRSGGSWAQQVNPSRTLRFFHHTVMTGSGHCAALSPFLG